MRRSLPIFLLLAAGSLAAWRSWKAGQAAPAATGPAADKLPANVNVDAGVKFPEDQVPGALASMFENLAREGGYLKFQDANMILETESYGGNVVQDVSAGQVLEDLNTQYALYPEMEKLQSPRFFNPMMTSGRLILVGLAYDSANNRYLYKYLWVKDAVGSGSATMIISKYYRGDNVPV